MKQIKTRDKMKQIKTFEEFLNEAYSPNSTENIISSLFNKAGFDDLNSSKFNGGISIGVDLDKFEGVEKSNTPKEITKLQKLIRSWSDKNDGVLVMRTSLGYSSGNGFTVTLADSPIKVNKVYHKTSRKNVESILKDGMMSTKAHGHSDTFSSGLSRSNKTEQLYRATFGVTTKSNAKKLSNYFKFTDPVILEINAKSYTWYQDPLMPPDMKSVFSYDSIKPEDIKIQE